MLSKVGRLGVAAAMLLSLMAMGAGTAFAATEIDSPGDAALDTTQLNYTGQGTSGGQFNEELCGDSADPGAGGFQNGADANNYILWLFNSNATTTGDTLHVNGNSYAITNHQIVTPAVDLSTVDAYVTFTVTDPGHMVLTISHGCGGGGEEDQPLTPDGWINGPCADPAYYATFDNTSNAVPVKFRFTWYNTHGLNRTTKIVPAGFTFITYQHWAKPGTLLKVGWKDPNTGHWHNLDTVTAAKGHYPPCDPDEGFHGPA